MLLRCLSLLALAGAPAAAVTFTSTPGAPDPGLAKGQSLLVSFDVANAAGVRDSSRGNVITAAGSRGGVRAAPAGIGNSVYRSIGAGGESVFDFSGFTRGQGLLNLSVYWGSIDKYNFVDLLDVTGRNIYTIGGAAFPLANGNQTASATNRRVFFDFRPEEKVTAVRFRSDGEAFEFDNIGGTAVVPEPEDWALLIIGFALIGMMARRRTRAAMANA